MNNEQLLSILNDYFSNMTAYYTLSSLPMTIGNAIYSFGSNDIRTIISYIDCSKELDGSQGLIFSDTTLYYGINKVFSIEYKDIEVLELHKNRKQISIKINNHLLDTSSINVESLLYALSEICELDIVYKMSDSDKIAYFTSRVIEDIRNDIYEDVELTYLQDKSLNELKEELDYACTLDDVHYHNELESVCVHALKLFDELELDSEEIDELERIQSLIEANHEKTLDEAKDFYDDVMNKFNQGDTKMYDKLKRMMNMMGISEEELRGKSMDEIEEFLCQKFNISKEMINSMKKRMGL